MRSSAHENTLSSKEDGTLFFVKQFVATSGGFDYEFHKANPESRPDTTFLRRIDARQIAYDSRLGPPSALSPDGRWVALALMNRGCPLDRVLHEVEVPVHLRDKPYLQPVYDHPQFLVRNVWRRYGGWYDGEPDLLLPAPRWQQAATWVELAGGVGAVLARAAELRVEGDLRLACHLVEFAVLADPTSAEAHALRTEVYAERAEEQTSSMARNLLRHAALASEEGKRDLAGDYSGG